METLRTDQPVYSQLGGDPDLGELVSMFVEEIPSRISAFRHEQAAGNRDGIGRLAHQMKGAAGSYGFDQATPYAARLEKAARGNLPEEEMLLALNELLELCSRMRAGVPND
jgi:HPt (histidine-containing phosphotransfer) domain-containing protein